MWIDRMEKTSRAFVVLIQVFAMALLILLITDVMSFREGAAVAVGVLLSARMGAGIAQGWVWRQKHPDRAARGPRVRSPSVAQSL